MTSAAVIRRPAIALGATLAALTLTGPAFGQTVLDGVGSTVESTTEVVQPVTDAVADTATQATAPVANAQPAQTTAPVTNVVAEAAGSAGSTASAATTTAADTVGTTTKAVTDTAKTVTSTATKAVAPVARSAAKTVTRTLEFATGGLPSATQPLLGSLVDTVDAQAEKLLGPDSSLGTPPLGSMPTLGSTPDAAEPATQLSTNAPSPPADRRLLLVSPAPDQLVPQSAASGPSNGTAPAGATREPGPVPVPDGSGAPVAPFSAGGAGAGFSAALAVLAGLLAFVLAASLGRLQLWSDLIRPLAFVSPPDRPG